MVEHGTTRPLSARVLLVRLTMAINTSPDIYLTFPKLTMTVSELLLWILIFLFVFAVPIVHLVNG